MIKRILCSLVVFLPGIVCALPGSASLTSPPLAPGYYATALCAYPAYECIRIEHGQSWDSLFPDVDQRDLVQRINRTYNSLWVGKVIAVPRDLAHMTMLDLAPFPIQINAQEKQILIDQDKL